MDDLKQRLRGMGIQCCDLAAAALDAKDAEIAEAVRLVRSCLIHIRDDAHFSAREALLAWGQEFLARAAIAGKE